jgi:hypothetical protein
MKHFCVTLFFLRTLVCINDDAKLVLSAVLLVLGVMYKEPFVCTNVYQFIYTNWSICPIAFRFLKGYFPMCVCVLVLLGRFFGNFV